MNRDSVAPRLFAYMAGVLVVGGLALFLSNWTEYPVSPSVYLFLMIAAAVLSEHFAPTIGGHSASISTPLAVAAMTLGGPCAAAIVASISALRRDSLSSVRLLVVTAFNFGQYALILGAAGRMYVMSGGPVLTSPYPRHLVAADFPKALLPMTVAVIITAVGNMLVTACGISILYKRSLRDSVLAVLPHGSSLAALGFVGFLIAQVVASEAAALPLFLFPLVLARQLYQRYAVLNDAYLDTVRSLVSALEAKDPYTRGHSVRVAEYAVALGVRLGLDERTLEMLEKSALLHDIGKLALSSSMLLKTSGLTAEEYAQMKLHPAIGAEMIRRIPPLRPLVIPVSQHHEQFAGGGYPHAIRGEDIHYLSRILAIADAYDAMTTTRSYRPAMSSDAAVAELRSGSGSQFDPGLVPDFVAVIDNHDFDHQLFGRETLISSTGTVQVTSS